MADTTTTQPPGPFDWLSQLLTGIGNLSTARGDVNAANQFAQVADPYGSQRSQWNQPLADFMHNSSAAGAGNQAGVQNSLAMLMELLQNPGSITSMPGYEFGLDQALEGVNRGAGASGMLNSGNRLTALQDRGQGYAQGWQQQIFNELLGNTNANIAAGGLGLATQQQGFGQLASLAGVNAGSPGVAAGLLAQGRQNQANSIGSGIGGITNGAGGALSLIQRMLGGGGGISLGSGGSGLDANFLENMFPGGSSTDIMNGLNLDPGADWGALFSGLGGP